MFKPIHALIAGSISGITLCASTAMAADWSTTEFHYQYGSDYELTPSDSGSIFTLQHASGWKYGSNFFFFDIANYDSSDESGQSPGNRDTYGEWYSYFSLGKITGKDFSFGPVTDVSIAAGVNYDSDFDDIAYLPGLEFALNIPGASFAGLQVGGYKTESLKWAYYTDFHWGSGFSLGTLDFVFNGHVEWIGPGDDVFLKRKPAVHAQPQLGLDIGKLLSSNPGSLYLGVEWEYWHNKLGADGINESHPQLWLSWTL